MEWELHRVDAQSVRTPAAAQPVFLEWDSWTYADCARSPSVKEAVRAAPHRCSRSKERGRRWRIVDGYNNTRMDGPRRDGNGRRSLSQNTTSHLQHLHHPFFLDGWSGGRGSARSGPRFLQNRVGAGGGVDPEAAAAWIVLFALSRNPRDFSFVMNCLPGRSAPARASQIA